MLDVRIIPVPNPSPSSLNFAPAIVVPSVWSFFVILILYFGVFSILKFICPLASVVACIIECDSSIFSPESICKTSWSPSTTTLNCTSPSRLSYEPGVRISFNVYVLSTYRFSIVNVPELFVVPILVSSPSSLTTLNVAPCTGISVFSFTFVRFRWYFLSILNPSFVVSVCVLNLPSAVSRQKYTACALYETSLYCTVEGTLIWYVNVLLSPIFNV